MSAKNSPGDEPSGVDSMYTAFHPFESDSVSATCPAFAAKAAANAKTKTICHL